MKYEPLVELKIAAELARFAVSKQHKPLVLVKDGWST
jgi:hypothetical protein